MTVSRTRILLIDDEHPIHKFLGPALSVNGFELISAGTGSEGLAAIAMRPPDAVILDLGLPDIDGQDVLIHAREMFSGPIIILSARCSEAEKVQALNNTANDYIEKPFGVGEFIARLRVALRHRIVATGSLPAIRAGDVELDLVRRNVTKSGKSVHLSPREYELLTQLAQADGRVLTHTHLLKAVWGEGKSDEVQYLRVFIGHIRRKLEDDPGQPKIIMTETGVGYRFVQDQRRS